MKWQLYNKEVYNEIYFRGDTPRSISQWETLVVQANPECVYWLSPNAFIMLGYDPEWIRRMTTAKRNFPQCYFIVETTRLRFYIWAATKMEACRTLYEMALYHDFPSSFEGLMYYSEKENTKLPTLLLKKVLEKTVNTVYLSRIDFVSAYAGRVLASGGKDMSRAFSRCVFQPPAEEAFVAGMLSRAGKKSTWTELRLFHTLPFTSDKVLVRLMDGKVLNSFAFPYWESPCSERVLDSLRNSVKLQTLVLFPHNFISFDDYAGFLRSLRSSSLKKMEINGWDFRRAAFPVEIFHNLPLLELSMCTVYFTEAGWKSMRQEIPKSETLYLLEFVGIRWWGTGTKEDAADEFAVEFAQLLKDSPNIVYTNTTAFFREENDKNYNKDEHDVLYTTHFAPILEHNRLTKDLAMLEVTVNNKVRSCLVAEAIGRWSCQKPSSCYTVLKANVDVMFSYLSLDEKAQEARNAAKQSHKSTLSTTACQQNKQKTPSKRKR